MSVVIDYRNVDVIEVIRKITGVIGVDVAIESPGTQPTARAPMA